MRIVEYIHQGGAIMYILLALNVIGFAIMIAKFISFSGEKKRVSDTAELLSHRLKNQSDSTDSQALIELGKQEVAGKVAEIEKGLNTVKIIATISPLLGLLGTVIGVLIAFRVMSETGLSDPSNFAQGISMALITTVGGMIVAIPHYIGHNYLLGMIDSLEGDLEKQVFDKVL